MVADLIHVPDDDRNDNPRDSPAKLKPKPKTKHGSVDAAPPEPSQPSRPQQTTTVSSATSLDELPCKIIAGDLTLASHDYEAVPYTCPTTTKKEAKASQGHLQGSLLGSYSTSHPEGDHRHCPEVYSCSAFLRRCHHT